MVIVLFKAFTNLGELARVNWLQASVICPLTCKKHQSCSLNKPDSCFISSAVQIQNCNDVFKYDNRSGH